MRNTSGEIDFYNLDGDGLDLVGLELLHIALVGEKVGEILPLLCGLFHRLLHRGGIDRELNGTNAISPSSTSGDLELTLDGTASLVSCVTKSGDVELEVLISSRSSRPLGQYTTRSP